VDDVALPLDAALHRDHAGGENDPALAFVERGPDHQVGDAGFVLDGNEHDTLCGSRLLTYQDQAGRRQPLAVAVNANVVGIQTGSRQYFENMNRFIEEHRIIPVVDRGFLFDEALQAFAHMSEQRHFGELVINVAGV
jgi:hypothetical protein